ncbi:MAG: RecQ family ATP-dependent DNA helicase, partial [Kiritimatiellae bacterium]|nr:RecQ family ATP-dependent DNA helicase [Kiritimatiellia bacterium]
MQENQTTLLQTLEAHFGHRAFLEGQEEPIQAILAGDDTLIIMPTGGGKSLCYQLPALMQDGITLVVSPLIALMKDQVDALRNRGIAAATLHSGLTDAEMSANLTALRAGTLKLIYVAPERFKSERFLSALEGIDISLFAVDEAHCISQWGHDFRPDYMRLHRAIERLGRPVIAAMTATATPEVRDDILTQLKLDAPKVFVSGFARPNLTLHVTRVRNRKEKIERIAAQLQKDRAGIIYCATRKNAERVAAALEDMKLKPVLYHGGLSDQEREKAQNRFMAEPHPVVVATNAFGMGIDRPDIRFVVHFDIPGSVEAYYQEAGRAGRDGEPATCELLFNYADVMTQEFFIEGANPTPELIRDLFHTLKKLCADGPIEQSIQTLAENLSLSKNGMATGSALYLLERAGVIERAYQPGSRTYTTTLLKPDIQFGDLNIDLERLQKKRERDLEKLKRMIRYIDHRGCRHQYILGYFGDEASGQTCHHCDTCLAGQSRSARIPDEEETVVIQKALSCVARVDGRFGRGRIAQTLLGSKSRDVLDVGLDRLSTYGLLSDKAADYVWEVLDALVAAGCLQVVGDPYPTLSLTPLGRKVMMRQQTVPLLLPQPGGRGAPAKRKTEMLIEAPDADPDLVALLKEWRRNKAVELGNKPAYTVYTDKTLHHL